MQQSTHIVTQPRQGSSSQLSLFSRARRNPRVLSIGLIWMLGLYAGLLASPPRPPPEAEAKAAAIMREAELELLPRYEKAYTVWSRAADELQRTQVWFWRWRPEAKAAVHAAMAVESEARREYVAAEKALKAVEKQAKSVLGLWSDIGVGEARKHFWRAFEQGKVFARRQTFWDSIYSLLFSRDEELLTRLLKLLVFAVVNFTTGMVASIFIFLFTVPSIIASFGASWGSGILFFVVALIAAVSVVAAFLGLLYGTSAAAAYALVSLSNPRLTYTAQRPTTYVRYRSE